MGDDEDEMGHGGRAAACTAALRYPRACHVSVILDNLLLYASAPCAGLLPQRGAGP
jgi:hypothetical protein